MKNFQATKLSFFLLLCMGLLFSFSEKGFAQEMGMYYTEEEIEGRFFGMENEKSVIITPEGGILHGEMTVYDSDDQVIEYYNSETDPDATTVAKLKYKFRNTPKNLLDVGVAPRVARPASGPPKVLSYGGEYISNKFSGSGWQFAGYLFKPATGTGNFLRWSTYNDSGRVGDEAQAWSTYNGGLAGNVLDPGPARWFTGANAVTTYYSFNPVNGSFYFVANKEP
ncbi:hypothetical protein [Enterococcus sp. AZ192]|uniref:hypothetical protein n=1 Tax=unclassified Enterococcus TaxID=2608891 RepID=UPI003D28174C